jgi:hypothetical protein
MADRDKAATTALAQGVATGNIFTFAAAGWLAALQWHADHCRHSQCY